MRMKKVLLLALIVCWKAVCHGKDEFMSSNEKEDALSKELAQENLFKIEKDDVDKVDYSIVMSDKKNVPISKREADKKVCDCGDKGSCSLESGDKVCTCNAGYAEKEGKCLVCDCGDKGSCSLESGDKVCTCNAGYAEKEGKCLECNCGEEGTCSFDRDEKKCNCQKGYIEKSGTCTECNCGDKGTCSFDGDEKKCVCETGYIEKAGACTEECDCGPKGTCKMEKGQKMCTCLLGYVETAGMCKECNCGDKGTCSFDGDEKKCACETGYIEKAGTCTAECDCGPKGTCKIENGKKKCTCESGFLEMEGMCKECICGDKGTCSFDGGKKTCACETGYIENKGICTECDCGKNGECKFDGNGNKDCTCITDFAVKEVNNKEICVETCRNDDDCEHKARCEGPDGKKFCSCNSELEGDKCEIVKDCFGKGKYSKCQSSGGKCDINGTESICICPEDKKLDPKHNFCRMKCSSKNDCKHGAECTDELCQCPDGTEGDDCGEITLCKTLKCPQKDATCKFDFKKSPHTFCVCNKEKYTFEGDKCVAEWCKTGCKAKDSKCEYKDGVGICKCINTGFYYDYGDEKCKKIDSCFNKTCGSNEICSKGECKCYENYRKNGTTCEPLDLCNPNNRCFSGAQCEKGSSLGYVKCLCNSASKFYLPNKGKCDDGVCFLDVDRKGCKKSCPTGMTRKEGQCEHNDKNKTCDEDCGFLGWCQKINNTAHKCLCDSNYAEEDKNTKKCVLKTSAVCPVNERDGYGKCKCTGKYKQATNGITCDLKSCSDEDVQKECKMKRATKCVDNWKDDKGYKCVCPEGYIDDKDKGCIDPCSQDKAKDDCSANGQKCFIGQKIGNIDCRCPPAFTYDGNKKSCDLGGANAFIISSLPVLSEKYETIENNINKVLLNIDVSTSMMQAFRNLDFAHVLDFKVDKAVLFCDVWLQFQNQLPEKFNASAEVQRWRNQIREINERHILLPGLFLRSDHTAAKEEELTLCIPLVQQSLCGTGSTCENSKCFCETGFREIDSTIKASGNKRIVRCEDIDECKEGKHNCADNSECVNTPGDYFCKCKPGFKKEKGIPNALDKTACIGLCDANPCGKGTCKLTKENTVDCTCPAGYTGSFCNREDVNLAKASKATKVVGAILGTLLAIVIILIIVYVVRQRKNSYSEDFTPAPRVDNAEMVERRPMRGVTNRAYQ